MPINEFHPMIPHASSLRGEWSRNLDFREHFLGSVPEPVLAGSVVPCVSLSTSLSPIERREAPPITNDDEYPQFPDFATFAAQMFLEYSHPTCGNPQLLPKSPSPAPPSREQRAPEMVPWRSEEPELCQRSSPRRLEPVTKNPSSELPTTDVEELSRPLPFTGTSSVNEELLEPVVEPSPQPEFRATCSEGQVSEPVSESSQIRGGRDHEERVMENLPISGKRVSEFPEPVVTDSPEQGRIAAVLVEGRTAERVIGSWSISARNPPMLPPTASTVDGGFPSVTPTFFRPAIGAEYTLPGSSWSITRRLQEPVTRPAEGGERPGLPSVPVEPTHSRFENELSFQDRKDDWSSQPAKKMMRKKAWPLERPEFSDEPEYEFVPMSPEPRVIGDGERVASEANGASVLEEVPKPATMPFYGAPVDIPVGMWWSSRMECSKDRVHCPPIAGIHGGPLGAYSISMSGGYEENEDNGEYFWFCGEGGRDLKGTEERPKNARTGEQIKDMVWSRGNTALYKSFELRTPVRVIRGVPKKRHRYSRWAPEAGYRYDGLYQVVDFQVILGKTGHKVFRFLFQRFLGQDPIQS